MILFIFAHQDDEFFAAERILYHLKKGDDLRIIYTTNGVFSRHNADVRKKESIHALKKLGIEEWQLSFLGHDLGIVDGEVCKHYDIIIKGIMDSKDLNPNQVTAIYVTAFEGGHHDHDATYLIAAYLAQNYFVNSVVFEFFLYNAQCTVRPFFRVMTPTSLSNLTTVDLSLSQAYIILCLIPCYKSQWVTFLGLLPQILLRLFCAKNVQYRHASPPLQVDSKYKGIPLYARRARYSKTDFDASMNLLLRKPSL